MTTGPGGLLMSAIDPILQLPKKTHRTRLVHPSPSVLPCYVTKRGLTMQIDTALRKDVALMGLLAGLGLGVLGSAIFLLILLPMIAHDLFGTYLHYGASALEYAAGYVAVLGLAGVPTALLVADVLTRRTDEPLTLGEAT